MHRAMVSVNEAHMQSSFLTLCAGGQLPLGSSGAGAVGGQLEPGGGLRREKGEAGEQGTT